MKNLTISILQCDLLWQQPEANRTRFEKIIGNLGPGDLAILPEMFTTGFTMEAKAFAETMAGPTLEWMARLASDSQRTLTGSLIIQAEDNYYNRLIWMRPDGSHDYYDKRHLFRMAGEDHIYAAGRQRKVFLIQGWRVLPQVCYDLRFPVWSRNNLDVDLIIYVANWPQSRRHAWSSLLKARAIENLVYVAAVNRVGDDGHDHAHSGDSTVLDYDGRAMMTRQQAEFVSTVVLDYNKLTAFRETFPAYLDADLFSIDSIEQHQDT